MKIYKLATAAAVALALATGAALAQPMYPQTTAQVNFDLAHPNGITYVPVHK